MQRPSDLPDFENPPLSEVVLGVQFLPPTGYSQIYAKDVWDLYRSNYPNIKELDPVPPSFEIFGVPTSTNAPPAFSREPVHDRYWFISNDKKDLIQFQPDRLLHNWRKLPADTGRYPRFETIIEKYDAELAALEESFKTSFNCSQLEYTQCEASYINLIPLSNDENDNIGNWVNVISIDSDEYENYTFSSTKVLKTKEGAPYARCFIECRKVFVEAAQHHAIELKISVRGAPETSKRESALWFLYSARNEIVRTFDGITTKSAHSKWGKK